MIPVAGVALGAAAGARGGAFADVGINDRFMKDVAQTLQSGNAALFRLIRKMTTDKVLAASQGEGGTMLRSSLRPYERGGAARGVGGPRGGKCCGLSGAGGVCGHRPWRA